MIYCFCPCISLQYITLIRDRVIMFTSNNLIVLQSANEAIAVRGNGPRPANKKSNSQMRSIHCQSLKSYTVDPSVCNVNLLI